MQKFQMKPEVGYLMILKYNKWRQCNIRMYLLKKRDSVNYYNWILNTLACPKLLQLPMVYVEIPLGKS